MRSRRGGRTLGLLLAGVLLAVGILGLLAPVAEAACTSVGDGQGTRCTAATQTNKDPEKRIFVLCPQSMLATGGGAQIFSTAFGEKLPPGQRGRVSITQVIPADDLRGYAARAQAENGFNFPWHLTAYVICK